MKTNKDLILRKIAGEPMLVPIGEMADQVSGLITLNEVAEFIWSQIDTAENEEEILQKVLAEFEIDEETARFDVYGFINELRHLGMIE